MFNLEPQSKRIAVTAGIISLILSGCGSTPQQSNAPVVRVQEAPTVVQEVQDTPLKLITRAKSTWLSTGDETQRNAYLLDAAELFHEQGDTVSAHQILMELANETLTPALAARFKLLVAQSQYDGANVSTTELITWLNEQEYVPSALQSDYAELLYRLYSEQGNAIDSVDQLLKTSRPDEEKVEASWNLVSALPEYQLNAISSSYPELAPYIALRQLAVEYAYDSAALSQAVDQFTTVYRSHPLVQFFPSDVTQALTINSPEIDKIAVLLPLSGRLESTGNTVKEGVLAAYYSQYQAEQSDENLPSLQFIDTNEKSIEQLIAEIGSANFIIGPLLKENVEALSAALPPSVNMLALNRLDTNDAQSLATNVEFDELPGGLQRVNYFSLAPEDEAIQLADYMFNKGIRAPVLVHGQSALYQRMSNAFDTRWQTLVKQHGLAKVNITTVTYSDSASLREGITRALDVEQSKERIKQIDHMVNENIYNMPRSRHDIDAIVAFTSPQDTELLNPIIEASLTPYEGKVTNVYATSRSMEYTSAKNQWRDLQNVHFLDMPWVMPNNNWQALRQSADQIWPDRTTLQSRLFAFGVDAYRLLPNLGVLNTLPYTDLQGLTGKLSINTHGEVERVLPHAVILRENIQLITD